ncbi:MAG: RluA family pseudouridine synthase [Candidatus Omnitrophota bacterium]
MEKKTCIIDEQKARLRLDVFLKGLEPECSRMQIQDLILSGGATVNGAGIKPHYKLKIGDQVEWSVAQKSPCRLNPEDIPITIIFEDADIIVLDKPSGLVVHPGAGNLEHTLVNALLFHTKNLSNISQERPGIVHRLDKDTSGVMVVAKNNHSHLELARQFKKHSIERRYIALVSGVIEFDEGIIDVPLKRHILDRKKIAVSFTEEAKSAHTFYKVLKRFSDKTAVALYPKTGRTHQLRVHLAYLGHPILGDMTYGKAKNFVRLALHAKDLGFYHPSTGELVRFKSPLPKEMKEVLKGVKV